LAVRMRMGMERASSQAMAMGRGSSRAKGRASSKALVTAAG